MRRFIFLAVITALLFLVGYVVVGAAECETRTMTIGQCIDVLLSRR